MPPRARRASRKRRTRLGWTPRDLVRLARMTVAQWREDKAPKLAAALAYYTAFSIGPILLITIAAAGLIFGPDAARGAVAAEVGSLVGQKAGESIEALLKDAWRPATGILATILGAAGLLFGATGVFGELQDSLNIIWKVEKKPGRGFWGTLKDRGLSFGMVAGIGFLLLVSLAVTAGLKAADGRLGLGEGG